MRLVLVVLVAMAACSDDGVHATVTVDVAAGIVADGAQMATLTIALRDGAGAGLARRRVTVSGPDDVVVGPVAETDGEGVTHASVSSTVAGSKTLEVIAAGAAPQTVVIEFVPGPVAGLVFVDQPIGAEAGEVLAPVRVGLADAFDNVVTTAVGSISVTLQGAGGTTTVSLSGTTTVSTVGGVATFSDLAVGTAASGLVLRATSNTTAPLVRDSEPFDVALGAPVSATSQLIVTPSAPATVDADGITPVSVEVTLRNAHGVAIPGAAVVLAASGAGKSFSPHASGQTDGLGQFRAVLTSTAVGSSTVTATSGALVLDAAVTFVAPPCVPHLPGAPATILGDSAASMVVADFDGDGHRDAAVLHRTTSTDLVSIVRGAGNGRFHAPVQYAVAEYITNIAAADLDGDSDIDLVLAGGYTKTIHVMLNDGTASFQTGTPLTVPHTVYAVAAVDFTGDGKTDLVSRGDNTVMTAVGTGNGTFQPAVEYMLDSPAYSASNASIAVARLDGNATFDLFTIGNGYYTVLLGTAAGTFQALPSVQGASVTDTLAIADFDGDSVNDVVAGLHYLHGVGNGTFGAVTNLGEPFTGAVATASADLDGDAKQDLVVSMSTGIAPLVRLSRGNGLGAFTTTQNAALGRGAVSLAVADFDEDGKLDVLALQTGTPSSLVLLRGTGTGTVLGGVRAFGQATGADRAHFWAAVADFDGNTTLDFVAKNLVSLNTGVHLAAADGTLTPMSTVSVASIDEVATGDFDGDTKQDVLTLGGSLRWMRGNGDGTLQAPVTSTMPGSWGVSLRLARMNADTNLDAVFVNPIENKLTIAFGTGTGTWTNAVQYDVATYPMAVEVADLDGDGDVDVAVASRSGKAVTVLTNDGAGVLAAMPALTTVSMPASIVIGDVDGDTYKDLIIGDTSLETVGLFRGTSTGSFASEARVDVGTVAPALVLRDLDGDGLLDLLVSANGLFVARGIAGTAGFQPPLLYDVGFATAPIFADIDRDGVVDIMTPPLDVAHPGFTVAYGRGCQ